MTSVPLLIPSLQSVMQLWQRPRRWPDRPRGGLLLALSTFQEHHRPLPGVEREAALLTRQLDSAHVVLQGTEATMGNLLQLRQEHRWAQFDYFHVATHAFSDRVTGRLSGLALADGDVWLDALWQLAPLPPLVTLSACSGLANQFYEGDEPLGLATTCLAAGAQSVVGSLWPVADDDAPVLMEPFYRALTGGERPAKALALAQRTAAEAGWAANHWGGFQCVGCP
jgi:CHAT domain-containing protein